MKGILLSKLCQMRYKIFRIKNQIRGLTNDTLDYRTDSIKTKSASFKNFDWMLDERNQTDQQSQKIFFLSICDQLIDCVFFELHMVRFYVNHD
jgi:hypothetical protein